MAEIKKKENGWWIRVTWPKPEGGKGAKSKGGFRTKRAAEAWARDYLDEVKREQERGAQVTLRELFDMYIERCVFLERAPTTIVNLRSSFHIWCGLLGEGTRIEDLGPLQVQDAVASLLADGKKIATVKTRINQLSYVMNYAVGKDLLARSPVRNIEIPVNRARKDNVYTADELNLIEQNLKDTHDLFLYPFVLSAHYGLRAGEACGVRWCDLDFDAGVLHVRGNLTYAGAPFFGRLKTPTSRADLSLLPGDIELFLALRRQREDLGSMQLKADEVPDTPINAKDLNPAEFVCWTSKGTIMSPKTLRERFPRILKKLGLRRGTWHDLRHSYGTLLSQSGLDIATVSKAMRHANISMTADRYVAPTRAFFETASATMASLLGQNEDHQEL